MQQTEQFKLNQWNPDDRILHTDFNADNLKLENALVDIDKRAGSILTYHFEVNHITSVLVLPMRAVKWDQCSTVHILLDMVLTDNDTPLVPILYSDGYENVTLPEMRGNLSTDPKLRPYMGHIILFPLFNKYRKVSMLITGMKTDGFLTIDAPYEALSAIYVTGRETQVLPGSSTTVYTMR